MTLKTLRGLALAGASALAISSAAAASPIASESFETGLTAPAVQYSVDQDGFDQGASGPPAIPGVTFSGYSGIITNGFTVGSQALYPDTSAGTQVAFLQSFQSAGGQISWALTGLTPGQQYVLSFEDVSALNFGPTPFSVSAFGVSLASYGGDVVPTGSFVTQTLDFTPSTANGSIDFIGGLEGNNSLTAIDNLTVSTGGSGSAAPEPSAWLLMIVGFGGIGAALRYRRRTATTVA
jgi:hypothetical protein